METNNKLNLIYQGKSLKKELSHFTGISFGIFLFILFFQPFTLEKLDFNNRLLFIAGLGAIVFLFMMLARIVIPWFIQKVSESNHAAILFPFINGFLILAFSSIAFAFYLKYVGHVSITFHIMFKIVMICLAPPLILRFYDVFNELKQQIELLSIDRKKLQNQIKEFEEINTESTIEFISENSAEKLELLLSDVVMIKSADNYVEIIFKDDDDFKKKLIRNTLKNIEQQIKQYSNFIRCHRTCIINIDYVENLDRKFNNYWLVIKEYNEEIPVSRQYLLQVKKAIII
ncbi:MAG: LytTR family transcriptional regulator DNA-binding domain-containing protein [Bacteroidales bacterium]|nr:LytTR family transcriptional regulator DNA-binding domain-containing protein [Bacteroidales bacterium]